MVTLERRRGEKQNEMLHLLCLGQALETSEYVQHAQSSVTGEVTISPQ